MECIILSTIGLRSSRRKVEVFYYFKSRLYIFIFLRIMFVKKALLTTTSVFYSEPRSSVEIKVVIKQSQAVKRRMFPLCSSFS